MWTGVEPSGLPDWWDSTLPAVPSPSYRDISLWPENPWLGWIWPALGFGEWHMAPQVIHPSAMGLAGYVTAATALGLSWGWVAYRTGDIRWTLLSHVLADGSELRNARFFLGS